MLMTFWRRKKIGEAGQALVEAAIILPLLILLVMGIIQYGFIFFAYATASNVSREAARASAISGSVTTGKTLADSLIPSLMQSTTPNLVTKITDANGNFAMKADVSVTVPLIIPQMLVVVTSFTQSTTMRVGG